MITLFKNARILTMESTEIVFGELAVENNKIIFIGDLYKEISNLDGVIGLIDLKIYKIHNGAYSTDECPLPSMEDTHYAECNVETEQGFLIDGADVERIDIESDVGCGTLQPDALDGGRYFIAWNRDGIAGMDAQHRQKLILAQILGTRDPDTPDHIGFGAVVVHLHGNRTCILRQRRQHGR